MRGTIRIIITHFTLTICFLHYAWSQDIKDYQFEWQIGSESQNLPIINTPTGVELDSMGNIYISDYYFSNIQKLNPEGKLIRRFGVKGSDDGMFQHPEDFAIDRKGYFYVADKVNPYIQKLKPDGSFDTKFGPFVPSNTGFNERPVDVAVDKTGNIYFGNLRTNTIQKLTADGTSLGGIGPSVFNDNRLTIPRGIAVDSFNNVYVSRGISGSSMIIQKISEKDSISSPFYIPYLAEGEFFSAFGLCVDPEGYVYVADRYNHRIVKIAPNGINVFSFGSKGSEPGQFNEPDDVATDSEGNIYVADRNNHRIQKFNERGQFIEEFGTDRTGLGEFLGPNDLALDAEENLYVVEDSNKRIQKFTADGKFLNVFDISNIYSRYIDNPQFIAIDPSGFIYIPDDQRHRINKFTIEGKYLESFGSWGVEDGSFIDPQSVSIDSKGNVYVLDPPNYRVQKFSPKGEFLTKYGEQGNQDGQLIEIGGFGVDSEGNVFISDKGKRNIQKFSPDGQFIKVFWAPEPDDVEFRHLEDIAIDDKGNVYVTDSYHNHVRVFSSTGILLAEIGSYGIQEGEFRSPKSVVVNSKGDVYISDLHNSRVQMFRPFHKVEIYSDSISSYQDQEVELNIRSNKFTEFISAQGTLEWNDEVATFLSAESVSLPNIQFNTATSAQGKMTFSWFENINDDGLTLADSTVLFTLRFRLIGNSEEQTSLSFTSGLTPLEVGDKEGKAVKVNTEAGKLYILPLETLRGRVLTESSQAIRGVKIALSGYTSDVDSTDVEGSYQLARIHPYQSYSVSASKQYDANYVNGLTSLDLAILQRHILDIKTLSSPYKLIAADVDLSKSITTADIRDIQNVVLGNTNSLTKGKHWTFIPKTFEFEDPTHPYLHETTLFYDSVPTLTGHDFIGIKLGDLNDTWDPIESRMQQNKLQFLVEEHKTFTGDTISIPVKALDFKNISSFQLTLEWNEEVLGFVSAQGHTLPEVVFGQRYVEEGQLTVLWYNQQGGSSSLLDDEVIFTVSFRTIGKIGTESSIALTSTRTPFLAYDAGNIAMATESISGMVEVAAVTSIPINPHSPNQYRLYQNEPNPFTDQLKFKIVVPKRSKVNLTMLNAKGQVIITREGVYEQGVYEMTWDSKDIAKTLEAGIYFVRLSSGTYQQTIKILKK